MRSTKMLYRNARDSLHRVLRVVVAVELAYSGLALQGPCCYQSATLTAMPGDNAFSPTLKAVRSWDISYDETFSLEVPSFLLVSRISAVGALIRYLTLLPSFKVIERTVSFPSSVGKV